MSDTLTLSVGEAAYVGLTLLDRFGAKLPKPVVTCLACGNDEPDLACDRAEIIRDKLEYQIGFGLSLPRVLFVDEPHGDDFNAAPLVIEVCDKFICRLVSCQFDGGMAMLGYRVDVAG